MLWPYTRGDGGVAPTRDGPVVMDTVAPTRDGPVVMDTVAPIWDGTRGDGGVALGWGSVVSGMGVGRDAVLRPDGRSKRVRVVAWALDVGARCAPAGMMLMIVL